MVCGLTERDWAGRGRKRTRARSSRQPSAGGVSAGECGGEERFAQQLEGHDAGHPCREEPSQGERCRVLRWGEVQCIRGLEK